MPVPIKPLFILLASSAAAALLLTTICYTGKKPLLVFSFGMLVGMATQTLYAILTAMTRAFGEDRAAAEALAACESTWWTADVREEIKTLGFIAWAAKTRLLVLDRAPDPGNPGQELILYRVPAAYGPFRVLAAVDGTPGHDGVKETVGKIVPNTLHTAIDAAAYTYGVPTEVYTMTMERK